MYYNTLLPYNKALNEKINFMNEFLISHLGPTLYISIDIENNILYAQNITLIPKNNIRKCLDNQLNKMKSNIKWVS